ncbi:hypothetical protein [Thiocapsa imhoffii]|nr:hypothetical protein [Thiocapsa imhoffii]
MTFTESNTVEAYLHDLLDDRHGRRATLSSPDSLTTPAGRGSLAN